jgi:hypothetical protein
MPPGGTPPNENGGMGEPGSPIFTLVPANLHLNRMAGDGLLAEHALAPA